MAGWNGGLCTAVSGVQTGLRHGQQMLPYAEATTEFDILRQTVWAVIHHAPNSPGKVRQFAL
ncbi:hypothetical protein SAMN02927895_02289 [Belnapia rosea]|nr:hypothetical protein SAMN02927895_02289 [Belnapia rosea]